MEFLWLHRLTTSFLRGPLFPLPLYTFSSPFKLVPREGKHTIFFAQLYKNVSVRNYLSIHKTLDYFWPVLFISLFACTHLRCGMQNLAPWPKIKAKPPALGAQSLRFLKWTTRKVPVFFINQLFTAVKAPDWLVYQKAENSAPLQVYHCLPEYSWRRKWQPTPVFLPGESQGQRSLVSCRLWGSHRVRHNRSDLAVVATRVFQCLFVCFN